VFSLHHSLHRKPKEAKAFYAVYGGLVTLAAAVDKVTAIAPMTLESIRATAKNAPAECPTCSLRPAATAPVAALVMLSIILTASVFFPGMSDTTILAILGSGMLFTVVISAALLLIRREDRRVWTDSYGRMVWRMPPLDQLPPAQLTPLTRIWLTVLRGYLIIAGALMLWRILELALSAG
jgi:hypothetical protein